MTASKLNLATELRAKLPELRECGSIEEAQLLLTACLEIERLCADLGAEENETHWLRESLIAIQSHCVGSADGEEAENLDAIEHICDWALREMLCNCKDYRETGACSHTTGIH